MRLAYEILKTGENALSLKVVPVRESREDSQAKMSIAYIGFSRKDIKADWAFTAIMLPSVGELTSRLVNNISQAPNSTPLEFANWMHEEGGRQVVWDKRQNRFRNVSTMKAGEDTWQAVGVEGITVSTEDEEKAVQRCKRTITELMMEKPEQAAELAKWFSAGCKVKKLASGSLPDAVSREFLANPDQVELAKKPIVIKIKKEVKGEKQSTGRIAKKG